MELSDYVTQRRGGGNKLRHSAAEFSAKASRKNRIGRYPLHFYDRVPPPFLLVGIVFRMEKRDRVSPVRRLRRSKFIVFPFRDSSQLKTIFGLSS